MLKIVTGRINSGKTTYVQNVIKERVNSGSMVYLIVPEQFSFESERRILNLLGERDALSVEVCSFSRLAQNILGDIHGLRRLDEAGRVALMSTALEETTDKLQVYGKFSSSIGVISEMLKISDEMKKCAVSAKMLEETSHKLENGMLRKKVSDLSLIISAFDALVAQRFSDTRDDLTILADKLLDDKAFAGVTVIIDGFKGFTQQEYDVIARIISQSEDVYISLCLDEIYAGEYDITAFASVRDTARKLINIAKKNGVSAAQMRVPEYDGRYVSSCLEALEQNLYSVNSAQYDGNADAVTVYSAKTAYEECDYVALTVKKLLREEGYRCRDIAVISRSEDEYSKSLRASLKKHGVPVFEDKRRALFAQPPVVMSRAAVEIAAKGYSTDAIFRLLKTQLTDLTVEQVSELENYVYLWQIDGRRWLENWSNNPSGLGSALSEGDKKRLERINMLREICIAPLEKFRNSFRASGNATQMMTALYTYLIDVKAPQNLKKLASALDSYGETADAVELGRVWDRLMLIFDQLSAALAQTKVNSFRVLELFNLVLGVQDIGVIPHGIDEIIIGSAERIRVNRPRAVFVVGVNDGVFPKKPASGRVLGDADRQILNDMGLSVAAPSQNDFLEERYIAYSALCCASERLYVTHCKTDFSGAEKNPSELIGHITRILPRCKVTDEADFDELDLIQSEASAFESAAKGWRTDSVIESTLKACFAEREGYAERIAALDRAGGKTQFSLDDSQTATDLFGSDIYVSATKIEDYEKCPFMYFCRHGLKLDERKVAEIDALITGTVSHFVLEKLVACYGKALIDFDEERIRLEVIKLLDTFLEENLGADQRDERFDFLYRRQCDSLCVVVMRLINEMKLSAFEPVDFELQIGGKKPEISQLEIDLEDGGKIILSGQVDRVDVLKTESDTFVRVMDYKTGHKKFDLNDVMNGLNMQMLLYLFTIRRNGTERYGNVVPAGVLYVPAKAASGRVARDVTQDQLRGEIIKEGRMSGILLDDDRVTFAVDTERTGSVVAANRKGEYDNLISGIQLSALENLVMDSVRKMGDSLHCGKIPADPKLGGTYKLPCEYCKYADICLHEVDGSETDYGKMKFDNCLDILDEEGEEDA
ncbi:MAG: PD-(D/E)XK nuclease family protein [Clostridia bacterium]|nr:PD-(D/E)XK nuclease family protein [Clostridia bacterium]